ncbi:MAG: hypothetical protein LUD02_15180 [Tannerellaceae bacterium]|nr:hypothetical protein [Tannerellaceae bacterium]
MILGKHLKSIAKIAVAYLLAATSPIHATHPNFPNRIVQILQTDLSVIELIKNIEQQTGYLFVYNEKDIDLNQQVRVSNQEKSVEETLRNAFSATDINYSFSENYISLRKKSLSDPSDNLQQNKKQVTGTIIDEFGNSVIGTSIIEKGTSNGIITDFDGNFSLSVSNDAVLVIMIIRIMSVDLLNII